MKIENMDGEIKLQKLLKKGPVKLFFPCVEAMIETNMIFFVFL